MTVYANPLRDAKFVAAAPDRSPRAFHERLPDFGVTPLRHTDELANKLGVSELWVKDESNRLGLPAFKMLGASWATYRLLERRRGRRFEPWTTLDDLRGQVADLGPITLATATDGNHGRAVARMARLLGVSARVRVPANTVQPRIAAIADEGADVSLSTGNYDQAVAEVARWDDADTLVVSDTSWDGYVDVPRWIIDGYSTIFAEIDEHLASVDALPPTVVVVPVGVGALAAAAVSRFRRAGASATLPTSSRLVMVEPVDAACVLASAQAGRLVTLEGEQNSIMAGLNCGTPSPIAWPLVSAGADVFVTVTNDDARDAMRALAKVGVESGESGAASLAGAVHLAASGALSPDDRLLLLSTEGATDPVAYRSIVDGR